MKQWLLTKKRSITHTIKLKIYKLTLDLMRKLRIYHIDEVRRKANSPEGMEWNDLLLLGMEVYNGQATVIYCSPNEYIGVATVPVDDIISGTAHIVPPRSDKSIPRAIRKERQFYTGINPIGTFDAGPLEPIDPSEYSRLQEERDRIRDEYRESQLGK